MRYLLIAPLFRYIMIPDQTNLLQSEISGILLSLPNVKAITQVNCYESPRKPTSIDIGSGYQYGTADWQHVVFESASECSTERESLAAYNVESVDSKLPLLERPMLNCDINIRCGDLHESPADMLQSLIGDVVTTLYHATRQDICDNWISLENSRSPACVLVSCASMDNVRDLTTSVSDSTSVFVLVSHREVLIALDSRSLLPLFNATHTMLL